MVGDLRRVFLAWLKRTELELEREKQRLASETSRLEEERRKSEAAIADEKSRQLEQLRDERRRAETEMQSQLRQVTQEREESRKKLLDERNRVDREVLLKNEQLTITKNLFEKKVADFNAAKAAVSAAEADSQETVSLNVGGHVFVTTKKTLLDGVRQDSFLAQVASSAAVAGAVAGSNATAKFVDRDSELFRELLNSRRAHAPPRPRDLAHSEALVREAQFYGISMFDFPLTFVLGGGSVEGVLQSAELLAPEAAVGGAAACWKSIRSMQTSRVFSTAIGLGGRVLVTGGQNAEYAALGASEMYDALLDAWVEMAALRTPRRNAAGVALSDGRALVMGGFDGERISTSVEALDARMRGWGALPAMATPRSSAGAVVVDGGRVMVVGGTSGERLKSVEVFDVRANKWETLGASGAMNAVRSAGVVAEVGGRVYAVGGVDGAGEVVGSLEMMAEDGWTFRASPGQGRVDAAGCRVDDTTLLVSGGQNAAGEVLTSVEIYDAMNDMWIRAPDLVYPRYGHNVVSLIL
jgi:hypothetical protein